MYDIDDVEPQTVTVSIPAEIAIQMVEAHPSIYSPQTVARQTRLRALMKQRGVIPQFQNEPDRNRHVCPLAVSAR